MSEIKDLKKEHKKLLGILVIRLCGITSEILGKEEINQMVHSRAFW